jgi:uncharacterized BrkB/YihY/UPF0761 family membrane protein
MTKPTVAFIALSAAAIALQLMERYGLMHWGVDRDTVLLFLLIFGLLFLVTLFVWSLVSVRQHKVRSVLGGLVCAYCLWQAFQNGNIIY